MRTASHAILYTNFVSRASIFALPHAVASARAKVASTTRPAPSRESPASTRPPRSRAPCLRSAHHIARESSSPARRPSRGYTLPPTRPNLPSEGSAPRQRAGENDFYDPPRAFTVISRVHSTATVARTVSLLGASYCTRIFVACASAFARLRAAANAPESAVGRKRAAPACGRKRLLRPAPRFHGNLPRPLDCYGRAHRALARRVVLHANLRLPRVGFRPAARRRQCARICRRKEARGRKRLLRPTPRFHGNLPRPLDHHGRAHRVLARRIVLHANLRLPRVGFRPATRCRQCARIRRRKEARRASVRAKTTSTTRPVPSR